MTGTYVFLSNRAKFNQHKVDPTCTLCGGEPEDQEQFLLRCRSLSDSLERLRLTECCGQDTQCEIYKDSNVLVV